MHGLILLWLLAAVNMFEKPNRYPIETESVFKQITKVSKIRPNDKKETQPSNTMKRTRTILLSKL
jgi:hypothetical protein